MSYYANGYGIIVAKEGYDVAKVTEVLEEIFYEVSVSEDTFYVSYHDKYYDEDLKEALDILVPFIKEGEIEFTGEDDCLWKLLFNQSTSKWDEINGEIVYGGLASYSDDALLKEIKRRGLVA